MDESAETMMMEETAASSETKHGTTEASILELWVGGLVLSWFSPTFYHRASRSNIWKSIGFFILFALLLTVLQTIGVGVVMLNLDRMVVSGMEDTTLPNITISGGVASVEGDQQVIFLDEQGMLIAIDLTGEITEIDRNRYDQGILLTETELHFLQDTGEYQYNSLADLNTVLGDPIEINEETIARFTQRFGILSTLIAVIWLFIWHVIIRLLYLLLVSLIVWGITNLFRSGTEFRQVFITGIYAVVPAWIGAFLMRKLLNAVIGFGLPLVFTTLLLIVWILMLVFALPERESQARKLTGERPLRLWRTLIGLPLIGVIAAVILVTTLPWWITWVTGVPVIMALIGVSLVMLLSTPGGNSEAEAKT